MLDDLLAELDLELAAGPGFGGEALQTIDVVEVDFIDFANGGINIAGNSNIDHQKGPKFPFAANFGDVFGFDDVMRSASG